jgi:NAD-dependent SIR2 family protein deacetylase
MSYAIKAVILPILLFLTNTHSYAHENTSNIFLQKPQLLSPADIEKRAQEWETVFCWSRKNYSFVCCYNNQQSSFLLEFCKVPMRSYNFQYITHYKQLIANIRHNKHSYYYAKPLQYNNQNPQIIAFQNLCTILQKKRFIFYTGAGISVASNVATMNSLMKSLSLSTQSRDFFTIPFFKEVLLHPKNIADAFAAFCKSAAYSNPTQAHQALHQIAQQRSICILTENVDLLQERTGSNPIHSHDNLVYSATNQNFLDIDMIICIGLSRDDCGLLAHYKQKNPHGLLVAIDLGMPNYLSSADYIVQDDCQVILPALANALCNPT